MSDTIRVTGHTYENAVLLLEAAEALGLPVESVATSEDGFVVPAEVAEKAGYDKDGQRKAEKKAPAKKTAAKKTAAKAGE